MFFLNTAFNQIINQFLVTFLVKIKAVLDSRIRLSLKLSGIHDAFKALRSELVIFHLP